MKYRIFIFWGLLCFILLGIVVTLALMIAEQCQKPINEGHNTYYIPSAQAMKSANTLWAFKDENNGYWKSPCPYPGQEGKYIIWRSK